MAQGGIICAKGIANTPAIASDATALAANIDRAAFTIQNCGTNALFVRLGSGATTSVFHVVLKAGAGNDDGSGGILSMEAGTVYTGIITIAGSSPRYVVTEL